MEDVRVSVRLTPEMHEKLKILAIRKHTNMNKLLVDYIKELIEKDEAKDEAETES